MQAQATSAAVCPGCGTRLEGAFSRGLGHCMICLLRVGFDDAEPDEVPLSSVADRLGNYRIERRDDGSLWELGRGAMGVTYRALDTSLRRAVALKLIDSEWVKRGAEARERFMREARTAASLRHPNIATVYHFGIREENGQCFCAIELVEGETLEMRVRRTGPFDALTTIDIALQVSSALGAAEKQGLVHRDLKPANLMFVAAAPNANDSSPGKAEKAETVVKVIDFGVAKALVEKPDAMGLTHGGFVGTPAFASPEQFTEARVDVRSDIYSLGPTLWYLLTGNRPFEGATIEQIRASQRSSVPSIPKIEGTGIARECSCQKHCGPPIRKPKRRPRQPPLRRRYSGPDPDQARECGRPEGHLAGFHREVWEQAQGLEERLERTRCRHGSARNRAKGWRASACKR